MSFDKFVKYKLINVKSDNIINNFDDNMIGGRNENLIIHISGPSGAGKTTIGNILKEKFKNKIIVKDIDELRSEFIDNEYGKNFNWKNFDSTKYQLFIDEFIYKQKKPIIFVGLNHMPWHNKKLYYNVHSQHNFYIKIDDMIVVKQKCLRFINDELQDIITNKKVIEDITKNNKKFVKLINESINRECGITFTKKLNQMWNKDYKKQGYKFMSRENIIKHTSNIIENFKQTL